MSSLEDKSTYTIATELVYYVGYIQSNFCYNCPRNDLCTWYKRPFGRGSYRKNAFGKIRAVAGHGDEYLVSSRPCSCINSHNMVSEHTPFYSPPFAQIYYRLKRVKEMVI